MTPGEEGYRESLAQELAMFEMTPETRPILELALRMLEQMQIDNQHVKDTLFIIREQNRARTKAHEQLIEAMQHIQRAARGDPTPETAQAIARASFEMNKALTSLQT